MLRRCSRAKVRSFQWSVCVCVSRQACTDCQERPATESRPARTRGPIPASSRTPKPSVSMTLALPALPLARTVNRRVIECSWNSISWQLLLATKPKPAVHCERAGAGENQDQADADQDEIVLIAWPL